MTTKTKAKKMTFRQRLRTDAEERLDAIIKASYDAIDKVKGNHHIATMAIMRLCSGGQTKSLRHRLITSLADEQMAELEEIYNRQQQLPMGDENADES